MTGVEINVVHIPSVDPNSNHYAGDCISAFLKATDCDYVYTRDSKGHRYLIMDITDTSEPKN